MERTLETLSLAVKPEDKTAQPPNPFGDLEVSSKDSARKPNKNPSGYFVYLTLEDGDYTVSINSQYYLSKEFVVTLPDHGLPPGGETYLDDDPNEKKKLKEVKLIELNGGLLAEVTLIPEVNYPFPSGATLVSGDVKDGSGNPVTTAFVNVLGTEADPPGNDLVYAVDRKGQFVLFCNRLTASEIKEINGKTYEGGRKLIVQAFDDSLGNSAKFEIEISDGQTKYQKITY